jgi:hypothetical protein
MNGWMGNAEKMRETESDEKILDYIIYIKIKSNNRYNYFVQPI